MAELPTDATQPQKAARHLPPWVILLAFLGLLGFLTVIGLALRRAQQGPITIGQTVPPINLTLFDGSQVQTTDMAGKVILINFWASWCQPCAQEAAYLQQAWEYYQPGGQVVFLGIDYVDTEPAATAYLKQFNITYPNGPDLATRISQEFRIRGVPETYIIDKSGKLAIAQIGPYTSLDEIKATLDPLLK
ncbi:MAG: TlpA family protein disulfide reductase [Chloroflexi bacterium]|nr:TlpA family protein disulfide reductase [Chloroflexota bacterium]